MSATPPSPNSPVDPQPPPSTTATPPPQSPPAVAAPPPKPSAPPPQPTPSSPPPPKAPPPSSNPPPHPSSPPPRSPPPASSPPPPPANESTPASPIAPVIPPPTPRVPSNSTPPSPTTKPPSPPAKPPQGSPPAPEPPSNSPPPPSPARPRSSPPPPSNSSTTPVTPSPPTSPPSSDLPPPPAVVNPPPNPSSRPSPSSSIVPPGTPSTNTSGNNASQNSQPGDGGGLSTGGTAAIILVVVLVFIGILGAVLYYLRKRMKASGFNGGYIIPPFSRFNGGYVTPAFSASSPESDSAFLKLQISTPKDGSGSGMANIYSPPERGGFGNPRSCFTYEELVKATNGFSPQNLLGEGGFGFVYKGTMADGKVIAVKQLKIDRGQGEREFRSEVEIISRIHHRHLVSLVGYCINDHRRLLVFDYVPNNNLYFHLHGEGRPVLDWAMRVKIAVGASRGIAYLHEDCHPRIIHRDIKSSNILVDNNFEARVSDFGLAKLAQEAMTHVTTRVVGTFGYMAPEYASSGKLTEKSDVFSFGVVLLELITGRKPVDTSQPPGEESLVEWARPLLSHALETPEFAGLPDPRLGRQYVDSEMFRMIEAAAACVRHSSIRRPKMGQVVRALDTMASTDLTNGMRVGESEMFNPAQQSAEYRLFQRMAFGNQEFSSGFFREGSWISEGDQVNSRIE